MPKRRRIAGKPVKRTIREAHLRGHKGILRLESVIKFFEVDEHRKEEVCEHYADCLEYASYYKWVSFSCIFCEGRPEIPKSPASDKIQDKEKS